MADRIFYAIWLAKNLIKNSKNKLVIRYLIYSLSTENKMWQTFIELMGEQQICPITEMNVENPGSCRT